MAIKIIDSGGDTEQNVNQYILDTDDDVAKLPQEKRLSGSMALVLTSGDLWGCNTEGKWVRIGG